MVIKNRTNVVCFCRRVLCRIFIVNRYRGCWANRTEQMGERTGERVSDNESGRRGEEESERQRERTARGEEGKRQRERTARGDRERHETCMILCVAIVNLSRESLCCFLENDLFLHQD